MTLVPSVSNSFWTMALALWPMDTIVVTAAMPITTPRIVRLARILFLARARSAIRMVIDKVRRTVEKYKAEKKEMDLEKGAKILELERGD